MLDENAEFLTYEQLDGHVGRLNRRDFQALEAEWEVAVLNAFSKLGVVQHEPPLGGNSKLDLLFTPGRDSAISLLADITAVSDEGFEVKNPVKSFFVELEKWMRWAGLTGNGFEVFLGHHPTKRFGDIPDIKLPPRGEFAREIFNAKFKAFLKQVKESPGQPAGYHIRTAKTDVLLRYTPGERYFTSTWVSYNRTTSKTRNPVFNALKLKAQNQLKKVSFSGPKGIILCDGSCDMLNAQPNSGFGMNYGAPDAIKEFLRRNRSVAFVLTISSVWTQDGLHMPWAEGSARKIKVSVFGNEGYGNLPESVRASLEGLERHFPEPVNIASGARETIRHGYDPTKFRPLAGGLREVSNDQIKVSANAVFGLLAGTVTQEEFFKALGIKPWSDKPHASRNPFEYMLTRKMRLAEIRLEEAIGDDSTLVFKFDGRDPAISPYINPRDKEPE